MQLDTDQMVKQPTKRARGRPKLEGGAMPTQRAIRFPKAMVDEIEAIRAERALEGLDFSQIVRELVADGLKNRKKR